MAEGLEVELQEAREGAAFARAGLPGLAAVIGAGRAGFLHGQLSADINSLAEDRGVPACLLSVSGKIVSPLGVFALKSEHLLVGPAASISTAAAALARMSPLADCTTKDLTGTRAAWLLVGPRRAAILEALAGRPSDPGPDGIRSLATSAGEALVCADFFSGPPAHILLAPAGAEARFEGVLAGAASAAGAVPLGGTALEILRLESGAAAWGRESGPDCFPQEVGLERAVHPSKGCYLGQEIMARLRDRGHVNRLLVGLRLDSTASPGDAVEDEAGLVVGRVSSVAPSSRLGAPLALAFVKTDRSAVGQSLVVRAGAARVGAEVLALPI